jgi:PAS domain S-box-containing protein
MIAAANRHPDPECKPVEIQRMTRQELVGEVERLRKRLSELEGDRPETRQARQPTQRREEPLRTIFQNAKSGMFILDTRGHHVDANQAGCLMTGYSREEILQSDVWLLLFPEDTRDVLDGEGKLRDCGASLPECRMRRKDGSEIWVEVNLIPFTANERELVLEIVRDVTGRKRTEAALQKAHDELERRIEERAKELNQTNRQLKREIEERKRTEEELKRTKEYLENVIENSVDAIGIVDRHGHFILWNRRAAEIFGYHSDDLAGKSALELYADPVELDGMLTRLRHEGVVREYEILMKKSDGNIVPMDISISLLKDDHGATIGSVCVARDLSERKRAEVELKRARDELSRYSKDLERQVRARTREITGILQYTPAVVSIKDTDGRYTLVNSRYEELFGMRNEGIHGKSDHDIFPKEFADQYRANDLQVLVEGRSCQIEESIPHGDGVHTYLSVKFPLYDEHGAASGICSICTDITELKKAQNQLRRLSGSIMAGQEKERAAIARELHDELGQVLTALRMDTVWMLNHLKGADPKAADRALAMRELIDKTIDEVRGIALRLRPSVLDDLGLIPALEWYTAELEKRSGIAFILNHHNVPKVNEIVATAAYRIAQEALTNVVRHASATHVEVTLKAREETLELSVVDNGRGFNHIELSESESLGVAGMRERANLAGGTLEIHSRPGKGTQVYCRLPISGKNGAPR